MCKRHLKEYGGMPYFFHRVLLLLCHVVLVFSPVNFLIIRPSQRAYTHELTVSKHTALLEMT